MADATVLGLGGSETPQPPPRAGGARRYNVERSCIRCHQKKIRCDKSIPCSTCVKSGNVESCRYPGPERAKRRPRREASTSLVEQVERLEQIVSNSLKRKRNHDQDERPSRVRSSSSEGNSSHRHPGHGPSNFTGLLIKDGNMVRYVNDHVLSHILEKEEEMRSAMTSPQNSSNVDTPGPVLQPFSLLHPISQAAYVDNFESLLPTRRRAIQLWQTFILNVDPMFKVLHIPTVQPIVYAAINEPHDVQPDLRALLFAIYFSAHTSTLRDVASCLNQDHEAELERFKRGIEISLSQADFLDQPTMQALQAMAIFIAAFRRFGSGRSIWTLNGMIIRAAQLMGIHRDGKFFNLSPFDQEMRHRLWWKIISTDSRTLEDQGMWTTGNRYLGDARLPLNIDDRDMSPQTTSMPQEHIGFAESTPLLSICHIHIAGEAVAQLLLCADLESYSEKLPATQEAIDRTRAELEKKFFSNHNPHIPIQRLFSNLTKMILDKLEWQCQERLLRHKQNNGREHAKGEARNYDAESDALFIRACELLDASLELVLDEIYTSYTWHTSSYPPYELLTFILWRMYTSSTQSSTDWAWQIVLRSFASIEESSIIPDMGTRWSILCKLKEKVAGLRTHTQNNLQFVGSPDHSPPHAGLEREARQENHDADVSLEGTTSDLEDPLFSMDWTTFQQSLNMDGMSWP